MENVIKELNLNELEEKIVLVPYLSEAEKVLHQEVLDVNDIMILLNCNKAHGYEYIKQIRRYSDRLKKTGIIHRKDYEDWLARDLSGEPVDYKLFYMREPDQGKAYYRKKA